MKKQGAESTLSVTLGRDRAVSVLVGFFSEVILDY